VAAAKKPSAASRTINMYERHKHQESVEEAVDADRFREVAFKAQEWLSNALPTPEPSKYRVTHKGRFYYLERLTDNAGMMILDDDLYEATKVMVAAVRAKQAEEGK